MFSDPVKNLKAFDLREDMVVADLGAGSGFYALPAASMVPKGKVYAVDIQRDFLTTIRNRAVETHLDNLEILWGDVEKLGGTKLGDSVVDAVIASSILFQVEDKEKFIQEARRILKPSGKLLLIDWSDSSSGIGAGFKKIVPKGEARALFEQGGFSWSRDIPAGEHHYGMIFSKKQEA